MSRYKIRKLKYILVHKTGIIKNLGVEGRFFLKNLRIIWYYDPTISYNTKMFRDAHCRVQNQFRKVNDQNRKNRHPSFSCWHFLSVSFISRSPALYILAALIVVPSKSLWLVSPFRKGGLRGIWKRGYSFHQPRNPPWPPFFKGGKSINFFFGFAQWVAQIANLGYGMSTGGLPPFAGWQPPPP